MSEDFNTCARAQLLTYVPKALRKQLQKHDHIIAQETRILSKDGTLDVPASMKGAQEQQKAAKAVIVHIEALIKLARFVMDEDNAGEDNTQAGKQELLDMIQEAQERVAQNRKGGTRDA